MRMSATAAAQRACRRPAAVGLMAPPLWTQCLQRYVKLFSCTFKSSKSAFVQLQTRILGGTQPCRQLLAAHLVSGGAHAGGRGLPLGPCLVSGARNHAAAWGKAARSMCRCWLKTGEAPNCLCNASGSMLPAATSHSMASCCLWEHSGRSLLHSPSAMHTLCQETICSLSGWPGAGAYTAGYWILWQ